MSRMFIYTCLLAALLGWPVLATLLGLGAALSAAGWLLAGPGGRWL